MTLCREDADSIEAEMRRLESAPEVSKRELRLYMQSLMPCGHPVACLLTCDSPPFGCCECNAAAPGATVDVEGYVDAFLDSETDYGEPLKWFTRDNLRNKLILLLRRALGGEAGA